MIIQSEPRTHSKRKRWTPREDNLIMSSIGYGDTRMLAERLGIGEKQVRERRRLLELRADKDKPKEAKKFYLTPTVSRPSFFEEIDFEKRLRAGR